MILFSFKTIPFLRIIIPFLAGIFFGVEFGLDYDLIVLLTGLGLFLLLLHFSSRKKVSQTGKMLYVLACDVFLFFSALYCIHIYKITNHENFYLKYVNGKSQNWIGEIMDLPQERENFYRVKIRVQKIEQVSSVKSLEGEVMAYVKKPFQSSVLKPGSIVKVQSRFTEVAPPLNPYEFDYRTYLARKNIFHQTFIEGEHISVSPDSLKEFSLALWGLKLKQSIIQSFQNSDLSPDSRQLCIALLTGYDDDISRETINAFAHSGTLHVLSVSGLHTGILYAVLIFFIGLVDRNKKYKILHVISIGFVLFVLSLITGFSPPVLRASIMLLLLMIGKYYFNYSANNSMNVIAVSAFIMLLTEPLLLYDAGFQLSYLAVIGIIYFEPWFTSLMNFDNVFLQKAWKLTSVSLAAQLGTLPVTLYLFHQFPLWFVFSNLLVIPLCTIVMLLAFLVLVKLNVVSVIINFFTRIIWFIIHLTDKRDIGYIDRIDFTMADVLFMAVLIFSISMTIRYRSYRFFASSLCVIIVWQFISVIESYSDKSSSVIGIYHTNKHTAFEIKNRNFLSLNTDENEKGYDFHLKPNLTSYNYADLYSASVDYFKSEKTSFFHLRKKHQVALVKFLSPEYILISQQPDLSPEFLEHIRPKLLIADGSNSYAYLKNLKEKCARLEIPFYSTKENGYLQLDL